jgi:hypothetical protein
LSHEVCGVSILFTAFLSPSEIKTQETVLVAHNRNNAAYTKGIKEGWSILFFPEKISSPKQRGFNEYGIIILPGVVNRYELATYIPIEYQKQAKESSKPFCFTDMKLAFHE